jgi:prevent-host-death family protein
MGDEEVSMRDLRNRTAAVLDSIEAGANVFITRNGTRVAALTSLAGARHPANADLLAALDRQAAYDSGLADVVEQNRAADVEAEETKADLLGETH